MLFLLFDEIFVLLHNMISVFFFFSKFDSWISKPSFSLHLPQIVEGWELQSDFGLKMPRILFWILILLIVWSCSQRWRAIKWFVYLFLGLLLMFLMVKAHLVLIDCTVITVQINSPANVHLSQSNTHMHMFGQICINQNLYFPRIAEAAKVEKKQLEFWILQIWWSFYRYCLPKACLWRGSKTCSWGRFWREL